MKNTNSFSFLPIFFSPRKLHSPIIQQLNLVFTFSFLNNMFIWLLLDFSVLCINYQVLTVQNEDLVLFPPIPITPMYPHPLTHLSTPVILSFCLISIQFSYYYKEQLQVCHVVSYAYFFMHILLLISNVHHPIYACWSEVINNNSHSHYEHGSAQKLLFHTKSLPGTGVF